MDYYELREQIAKVIPKRNQIIQKRLKAKAVQEKGRKSGYKEFKIPEQEMVPQERLLNTEEVNSFVEISCRAAACPMPLNLDVWDGLLCPFNCIYCFANAFRASLYTAFFDNSKTMGLRHCNPDKYKKELDELMKFRKKDPHGISKPVAKAIAMEIPMRLGIRFEDFTEEEAKQGISLEMLNYLAAEQYPVMINTKSALISEYAYVKALAENRSAAVHITLISSNNDILKILEPGAPTYEERVQAAKVLTDNGVQVVARIEPYLVFINDQPDDVAKYIEDVWNAGVRHITFDTYSYTAKNQGIIKSFQNSNLDWQRTFLLGCDSQAIGSLLLGSFMEMFRKKGFKCSTFDMGNAPENDDDICCEVGNLYTEGGYGFNWGCTIGAARFISKYRKGKTCSWGQFKSFVNNHGGFLSSNLEKEVHLLWNCGGNDAYSFAWANGLRAIGTDRDGLIWKYEGKEDFRKWIYDRVIPTNF